MSAHEVTEAEVWALTEAEYQEALDHEQSEAERWARSRRADLLEDHEDGQVGPREGLTIGPGAAFPQVAGGAATTV